MSSPLHPRIQEWRTNLLDLSRRNRLINCKIGTRGAIELEHPSAETIWQQLVVSSGAMTFSWKTQLLDLKTDCASLPDELSCFVEEDSNSQQRKSTGRTEFEECLRSPNLKQDQLLTALTDRVLAARLNRLALNAKTSITEQGVNILFIAFGLLEWYESPSSDIPVLSPLILVPAQLERAGPDALWKLSLHDDDVVPNQCVRELLRVDFHVELPEISEEGSERSPNRTAYLESVRTAVRVAEQHTRWKVFDRVILGTFSFQKLAIWQDLENNAERIASHDLCRAIGGDCSAPVSCWYFASKCSGRTTLIIVSQIRREVSSR